MKPKVAGVSAAVLEESKGAELEEPKIVTVTTPASLTMRWESEKGLKVKVNGVDSSTFQFQCVNVIS